MVIVGFFTKDANISSFKYWQKKQVNLRMSLVRVRHTNYLYSTRSFRGLVEFE